MMGRLHIVPMLAFERAEDAGDVEFSHSSGPFSSWLVSKNASVAVYGESDVIAVASGVGGGQGWVASIETPLQRSAASISLTWRYGGSTLIHTIEFELTDEAGVEQPFWTMDPAYWVLGGYAETRSVTSRDKRRLTAVGAFSDEMIPCNHERAISTYQSYGAFVIEERLTLHAIELEAAQRYLARRRDKRRQRGAAA